MTITVECPNCGDAVDFTSAPMTTLPEEAVNAAHEAYDRVAAINPRLSYSTRVAVKAALTAALPFLPVQGAVKIYPMETAPSGDDVEKPSIIEVHEGAWAVVTGTNGKDAGWVNTHELFAHQLYRHHILSTLEPSAARELALEEIIALCRDYGEDSQPDSEYRLACNDIIEAIQERRALSSQDHADAGKVEGDGWLPIGSAPIGSAPKDGTPFLVFVPDDDFSSGTGIDVIWYDEEQWLFGANTPFTPANDPTHWRPLPSAPASEGAE